MSIPLVALKPLTYAGKRRKAGEEFAARGKSDARVLIAIGSAEFAPAETVAESLAPLVAAQPPTPAYPQPTGDDSEQPRPRRTYRRRDLTAES